MRDAFFTESAAGPIFCTGALPDVPGEAACRVLLLPPFAEEMNRSRHVLTAIARLAQQADHQVLLPDLYGTGDSAGDFADASLDIWRADIDATLARMDSSLPLHVIALRAGALLTVDLIARHAVRTLSLIQPLHDGRQLINQMLRLRLAAGLMGSGEKETAGGLREQLAAGDCLEIAGYRLSPLLVDGIESLRLTDADLSTVERVHWTEIVPQPDRPMLPVSQRVIAAWEAKGVVVESAVVVCDQFWATQEIAYCPSLLQQLAPHLAARSHAE